jgi:hypothetical protein
MKKTILAVAILASSIAAVAQDEHGPLIDRGLIFDVVNMCGIILIIYLISAFILQLLRQNFDYRLKSKIVEKGTDEHIVDKLVQPEKKDQRNILLQWFCTLTGIAIGFLIMNFTQPFGLHSLAIMAFSVAAGLGVYYLLSKRSKNQ